MAEPIAIAVIGTGRIATIEHIPAIAASGRFALAATIDPSPTDHEEGVGLLASPPAFASWAPNRVRFAHLANRSPLTFPA